MEPASFSAAISGFVFIKDRLSGLVALRDERKLSDAINDISKRLSAEISTVLALQEQHSAQLNRKQELEAELRKLKETQAKMKRYELQQLRSGCFVYAPKEPRKPRVPVHYACPNCMDGSQNVSVLQPSADGTLLSCPACKTQLQIRETPFAQFVDRDILDPNIGY